MQKPGSSKGRSTMIITKARILLVDDEPLVLEIIGSALKADGYEVLSASTSQEALKYLDRTEFDGIVCDVRLENFDGFDILALSRKKNPSMAAILMTGAPCAEDSLRAEQMGASYLSKPIGMSELLSTVEGCLSISKKVEELVIAA
jgi:DNA-binding response OmpR family regulator